MVLTGRGIEKGRLVQLREYDREGEGEPRKVFARLLPLPSVGVGSGVGVVVCQQACSLAGEEWDIEQGIARQT